MNFHLFFCYRLFLSAKIWYNGIRRFFILKKILITGGAGYLGLNMAVSLLNKGYSIVIVDDLKNAFEIHINRLIEDFESKVTFYQGNVCDREFMKGVFETHNFDIVIHLAAHKYVGESITKPQEYFNNNIGSLETVLELAEKFQVKKLAFASSAVVYGNTETVPTNESVKFAPISPYAETKCIGEDMIQKWCLQSGVSAVIFRFSNPVGANTEYMFGDHSKKGVENLLPYIVRSAIEDKAMVFRGNNHATPDGTPIRDYISIVDLAEIVAEVLSSAQTEQCEVINVGRGAGFSLLELVRAVESELKKSVQYSFSKRSDLEASVSMLDVSKLHSRYQVELKHNLNDIVKSQIEFFKYLNNKK